MSQKKIKTISALCVAQPWAQCIVQHGKNVENKSTNLVRRGTIAIYASKSYLSGRFEACLEDYKISLDWETIPKGCIVGFVDIVDVITNRTVSKKTKKWFVPGCYGYVLENPILLKEPIPVKPPNGAILFWHLKGTNLTKCLDQLSKKQIDQFIEWK